MAEGAHAGLRLGPLTKSEIVQLALKTCKLAVLKVLGKYNDLEALGIEDLKVHAVLGPRENRLVLVVKDVVEAAEELGHSHGTNGARFGHGSRIDVAIVRQMLHWR